MTGSLPMELFISRMPKVDLHVHLDGSVKPETVLELAAAQGRQLPAGDVQGLLPYMQVEEQCESLKQYLSKFDFVLQFLQTAEALERTAFEVVEQAARHNCKYVEVRFAPQLHRQGGLTVDDTIRHVIAGLKRGEEAFGIGARAIAICMRHDSLPNNSVVIEAAARFLDQGLVAVDLAGDEAGFPAAGFHELFGIARQRGIPVTIHAGEAAGPDNIYEAIVHLGATRIGHGITLRDDPAVLELVKERQIVLEMCPVSNIQTKAVPDWASYPVREYYDQGLAITIHTDNMTVSGTNLTKEYEIVADRFGFTAVELAAIVMNGVNAAFLPDEQKQSLREAVGNEFRALGLEMKLGNRG
ncbi:adenosine deaminase [Paenibacillus oenotherae]|uniref:Adenosine deaminase n=1 Tax=Paenibacillus oenotherae TaxID=1435645 RepID=A0ABS7CZW2_9BACL|nr:adenosine deaminase [Paenibacillus oenotherae]MBW7473144.1 adenosine deaminase [Paenibacillus oenotherae]